MVRNAVSYFAGPWEAFMHSNSFHKKDCGDVSNIAAAGSVPEPAGDCNVACPGAPAYLCGGGNRISYYKWTGTPLNTWTVATGNNAGQYQFFIDGVVVPLITTQGVNGKITFVEKFGMYDKPR